MHLDEDRFEGSRILAAIERRVASVAHLSNSQHTYRGVLYRRLLERMKEARASIENGQPKRIVFQQIYGLLLGVDSLRVRIRKVRVADAEISTEY